MSENHRILKRGLLSIVVLLAVLLAVVTVALGPIVKKAVEAAGPAITGVPMQVENVRIHLLRGTASIDGLVVGAPSGFKANLAELHQFRMKLRLASLLRDTLVIEEIVIRGPVVTYELSGLRSNVGALIEALGSEDEKPTSAKQDRKGKKVIIDHFLFEGGKVRLATTLTAGKGMVLPLPKIEMRDIGRKQDGITALEAFRDTVVVVSMSVLTTVRDGIAGIAGLGADAVSAIAGSAGAGLTKAGALAGDTVLVISDLAVDGAKAAGGLAVDGAKAAGGLAADGAKAAGDLAGEGAKAVGGAMRSVGGLFGGKQDEPAEKQIKESETGE